ncbi:kinase, putative [Rhizoctonia solani]|uniref:Kinase, putative n=1 Tax=Rhizoctonia solani TaxID=456999 RepID=A0A0K6G0S7_9AGAM|nr:kinase, putative [Rhizoctonia solani]
MNMKPLRSLRGSPSAPAGSTGHSRIPAGSRLLTGGAAACIWLVDVPDMTERKCVLKVIRFDVEGLKLARNPRASITQWLNPRTVEELWEEFTNRLKSKLDQWEPLAHENLVRILGATENLDLYTEYLAGGAAPQYLAKYPNDSIPLRKRMIGDVLSGLNYLHSQQPPVIHGCIRMDKLFVDSNVARHHYHTATVSPMDSNASTPSPLSNENDPAFRPAHPPRSDTLSHISAPLVSEIILSNGLDVSESLQQQVAEQSPDGKRCLVTRDMEQLRCCHVLEPTIDPVKLQRLKLARGSTEEGLDVHISSNLLWLREDIHRSFSSFDWALVPTWNVLREMVASEGVRGNGPLSKHYIEFFEAKTWEYHFVPLRPSPTAFERSGDSLGDYTTHSYPFPDLEPLKSHVSPFFAVYNAGRKARYHKKKKERDPRSDTSILPQYDQHLNICALIYASWSKETSESSLPHISRPRRNRCYLASSSGESPSETSEEQYLYRDEQIQRRAFAAHDFPQSHSDVGDSHSHKHIATTSILDQYLPAPEESVHSSTSDQHLRAIPSGVDMTFYHWAIIYVWVAKVNSSVPLENPDQGGTEQAKQLLVEYGYEEARSPLNLSENRLLGNVFT